MVSIHRNLGFLGIPERAQSGVQGVKNPGAPSWTHHEINVGWHESHLVQNQHKKITLSFLYFSDADSSIKLEKQYFPLEAVSLYCDKSLEIPRPFVPKNLRQVVFQNLHFLSHSGISATTNLISKRFFWPGMRKDIKNRVRACEKCQRAKVFKHTKAPLSTFALPDARFAHIHMDYIEPYPPSKG
ncbi:transposon Ty3-I Gag-Pol polyprotein [Trichonephila clavipes]|nr:transposon Ty3-I Gag-Pol polyprotein [Trichonephila clavipes]